MFYLYLCGIVIYIFIYLLLSCYFKFINKIFIGFEWDNFLFYEVLFVVLIVIFFIWGFLVRVSIVLFIYGIFLKVVDEFYEFGINLNKKIGSVVFFNNIFSLLWF